MPLPDGVTAEDAIFLANLETAVNLVMDGRPRVGETVAVFGLGIVGLLVTALLAQFPLGRLVGLDCYPLRRQAALEAGAQAVVEPVDRFSTPEMTGWLSQVDGSQGFDLVYELSGSPPALDQAIRTAGYAGRVVVGSWYGQKPVALELGSHFHRSRIRLLSSQVSSVDPELSGRWSKARRFHLAWRQLERLWPSRWISHRVPLAQAAEAYRLLAEHPDQALQVALAYPPAGDLPRR
jgi:threonine dehydrogenase-like Zn-dependent dehydrogenase